MNKIRKGLRDYKGVCWIALALLVVPMFGSYFFDDMFSTVSGIFSDSSLLELGWGQDEYGKYTSGYSVLCIFGGLVLCGMLLDKWGVRITGSIFVGLMTAGAAMVAWAITAGKPASVSLNIAYAGCMIFGLGSEIAGVAVTRSIAKWFKNGPMALAMGLQLAISLLMVYLFPNTVLAHWIYLVVVAILLALAYVVFMKKYYHLHEEYLESIKTK